MRQLLIAPDTRQEYYCDQLFGRSKTTIIVNICITLLLWTSFVGCSFFGYLFCRQEVSYLKYFTSLLLLHLGVVFIVQKNIWSNEITTEQRVAFSLYYVNHSPPIKATGSGVSIDEIITSDTDVKSVIFTEKFRIKKTGDTRLIIVNTRVLKGVCRVRDDLKLCLPHGLCDGVILVDALLSIRAGEVLTIDGLLFKVDNDPALAEFVSNMKVMYGRRASVLLDYLFTAGFSYCVLVKPLKAGEIKRAVGLKPIK